MIDVKRLREMRAKLQHLLPLQLCGDQSIATARGYRLAGLPAREWRDLIADAVNAIGQLLDVYEAAGAWRDGACTEPNCGDGYTYHAHDCPTVETMRALIEAIDASRKEPA